MELCSVVPVRHLRDRDEGQNVNTILISGGCCRAVGSSQLQAVVTHTTIQTNKHEHGIADICGTKRNTCRTICLRHDL